MRHDHLILIMLLLFGSFAMLACSDDFYPRTPPGLQAGGPRITGLRVNGKNAAFEVGKYYTRITVLFDDKTAVDTIAANFTVEPADVTVWVSSTQQISGVTTNDYSARKRLRFIAKTSDGSLREYHVGVFSETIPPEAELEMPDSSSEGATSDGPSSSGGTGESSSSSAISITPPPDITAADVTGTLAFTGANFNGTAGNDVTTLPSGGGISYATGFSPSTANIRLFANAGANDSNNILGTCMHINGTVGSSTGPLYLSPTGMNDPGSNSKITFWLRGTGNAFGIIIGTDNVGASNPGAFTGAIIDASTISLTLGTSGAAYTALISLNWWKKITITFGGVVASDITGKNFQIRGGNGRTYNLYVDEIRYESD